MAYCTGSKKNFASTLDYHTLTDGTEVSRFIGQGETIKVNT